MSESIPIPSDATFHSLFSSFGEEPLEAKLRPYILGEWNNEGSISASGFKETIIDKIDNELAANELVVFRIRHRIGTSSIMLVLKAIEGGYTYLNDKGTVENTLLRTEMNEYSKETGRTGASFKFFVYKCPYDKDALMALFRPASSGKLGGGRRKTKKGRGRCRRRCRCSRRGSRKI